MKYVPEKETLMVAARGPVSDEEAKELTTRAISLLKDTQAPCVLGDFRGMESGPSFASVYWFVNDYANRGLPPQTRIALVHSRTPRAAELALFFETVCVNRRYEAKAFDSRQAAEAWLHSGTTA